VAVVHRIYAEALFEAAKEGHRLAEVREALAKFAAAVAETPELRSVLRNPQLESSEKARVGEIEEIAREFERLMVREERRLSVELTTARELSDDEAAAIVGQIEQAVGRKVEATRSVDRDLVGGIVVQAGSLRVDASVRGRLERLRQELVTR
jgi:F-type H+-transporting ATPase subunit delta